MHRPLAAALLLCLLWPATAAAQTLPAADVLARSIAFHDPDGVWDQGSFRLEITGTRPLAGPTHTEVVMDAGRGRFEYRRQRWEQTIEAVVVGDECNTRLDGTPAAELDANVVERFGLSCERMLSTRNYHVYLYGLPMKLRDPGTIIDREAERTTFEGADVWGIRVTYDPEVGSDTWYFYFDPETFAMVGYRFYHDEAANDGEYIVLDRLAEGGGLKLPKVRSWFTHADDRLLGTDTVKSVQRIERDD